MAESPWKALADAQERATAEPAPRVETPRGFDDWLAPQDFAALAGVKLATIHRYHHAGRIPPAARYVGRTPLWRKSVALEWVTVRRPPGRPKSHPS